MEGEFSLEGVTVSGPIPSHSSNGVKSLLSLVNSFQWRVHDALDQIGSTGRDRQTGHIHRPHCYPGGAAFSLPTFPPNNDKSIDGDEGLIRYQ